MTLNEKFTITAIIIGPVISVIITIWYQSRETKRTAQLNLYMDLISFREYTPIPWQFFVALNRIDVVFHENKSICKAWHEYFDLLCQEQTEIVSKQGHEKRIELMTLIGKHLGYNNIEQIYLQRYYQPIGNYQSSLDDSEIKSEFLRVLKNTQSISFVQNDSSTNI